jgi:uncharacterized repeat protein (TIGR03803 family)
MNNRFRTILLSLFIIGVSFRSVAVGATYRVVYYLTNQNQSAGGIIEGSPGVFYSQSSGVSVFSVTVQGTATTLASFADPPYNLASSPGTTGASGLVYSSVSQTINGGSGNVFSVSTTPGSEHIYPTQNLAPALAGNLPDGQLFGLVYNFSTGNTLGTVDLGGNTSSFYQFPSGDHPATPIYGADGNYYGISYNAGVSGSTSYFYRVTLSGSFTKVASLPFVGAGGSFTGAGLVLQGRDGNFYGIQSTFAGCGGQHGAVFKLTPSGQFAILHDFGGCVNGRVDDLIEGSDGKLYGVTEGDNVLFSLTKSGTYKAISTVVGGLCTCTLVLGHDGIIYGTASGGGPTGAGLIFALDAGLPVPQPRAQHFSPASGPVGARVRIWGYNLFGASVQFNGVPATQAFNGGPNYVWAAVPAGATTGPITITTPGGAVTTKASFTVQ